MRIVRCTPRRPAELPGHGGESFDVMYQWVKSGLAILAGAKYQDRWVGFIHTNIYKDGAYSGSSANDPEYRHFPISHTIQWAIIQWLGNNGIQRYELGVQQYSPQLHDIPSEKDKAISYFKRGFGGEVVPFYRREKYDSVGFYRTVWAERIEEYAREMESRATTNAGAMESPPQPAGTRVTPP